MAETGADPVPQQFLKALYVQLGQQQAECGIGWRLEDVGAETMVQGLAMAFGKPLHAHQRALVAENGEDRHQEHPPLGKADAAPHAAVWQGLEKSDQIRCSGWVFKLRNPGVRSGVLSEKRTLVKASTAAGTLLMSPGDRGSVRLGVGWQLRGSIVAAAPAEGRGDAPPAKADPRSPRDPSPSLLLPRDPAQAYRIHRQESR